MIRYTRAEIDMSQVGLSLINAISSCLDGLRPIYWLVDVLDCCDESGVILLNLIGSHYLLELSENHCIKIRGFLAYKVLTLSFLTWYHICHWSVLPLQVGYIVMKDPSTGARSNLLRMRGAVVVGVYHPLIDEKLMEILHGYKSLLVLLLLICHRPEARYCFWESSYQVWL